MPGINLVVDFKGCLKKQTSKITQAQKSLIHADGYFGKTLLFNKNYFIGFSRHESYPIRIFENKRFLVYLEGRIYNKNNQTVREEIKKLAEGIFLFNTSQKELVKRWLLGSDGDFVVLILNKISKEVAIINDVLGRLPLYFYKTEAKLLVSREVKFITPFVKKIEFDRMAIAEYLLFGHPLEKKTLLRDIFQLPPATLIRIDCLQSTIEIDNIHTYNFENKKYIEKNLQDNAGSLEGLFLESCKNRANCIKGGVNVLSLSGGLDSRAVGAGLQKNNLSFSGVTFIDFQKKTKLDTKFAQQVAKILNVDWKLLELGPTRGKDVLRLLKMKDGLNHLGMSFILSFFDRIKKIYGSRIIFFTGDEGNRLFYNSTPRVKFKDLDELVSYLIQKNYTINRGSFNLEETELLTGVNKESIINEIKKQIQKYPESDLNQKYVHFGYYENAFKWAFEGEDRNRFYFWSVAPFYSILFFDYIVNCPDKQKEYFRLQQKFLLNLSPPVSAVANVNWGFSILSNRFYFSLVKSLIRSSIYNRLPGRLKKPISLRKRDDRVNKKYPAGRLAKSCLLEQIISCDPIRRYFSEKELKRIVKRGLDLFQFYNLFTIISYIGFIKCRRSTLEKYLDSNLF